MAFFGQPRAVDAKAVALPGTDPREVAVPAERRDFRESHPSLVSGLVEQTELHARRHFGKDREVGAVTIPVGAERKRFSRADLEWGVLLHSGAGRGGGRGGVNGHAARVRSTGTVQVRCNRNA